MSLRASRFTLKRKPGGWEGAQTSEYSDFLPLCFSSASSAVNSVSRKRSVEEGGGINPDEALMVVQ